LSIKGAAASEPKMPFYDAWTSYEMFNLDTNLIWITCPHRHKVGATVTILQEIIKLNYKIPI
jgi:hypothetical protein